MAEKNQNSGCLLPVFKFKPHRTKPTVLGTFSSDDDHAGENVRKQSVLINKTLALYVRYQLWFISLSAMQCVSNACALVVTAAKFILHCIQVYVFGTVPRFTGAERLPPGGSLSAPLKFWAPVPKFFQDRYVYTAITGSAVPKNCQYTFWHILGCRANFLVRVNGVLVTTSAEISACKGKSKRKVARLLGTSSLHVNSPLEKFSFKCRLTKPKEITLANHNGRKQRNEPIRMLSKRRCHRRQARENTCERVTIGFGLSSDWLRKWHEFCQPITGRGKTKPKQTRITFDTAEFTIRYARVLRRALSPPPSRMEGEVKRDVNWFEI